ncbi:MAG: hypothetical protein JW839_12120 [Candidatus Lokiarchaeota archaeon]|nr:hypothetical protein [Candidatus Lokiarchaeota archaeon]
MLVIHIEAPPELFADPIDILIEDLPEMVILSLKVVLLVFSAVYYSRTKRKSFLFLLIAFALLIGEVGWAILWRFLTGAIGGIFDIASPLLWLSAFVLIFLAVLELGKDNRG